MLEAMNETAQLMLKVVPLVLLGVFGYRPVLMVWRWFNDYFFH